MDYREEPLSVGRRKNARSQPSTAQPLVQRRKVAEPGSMEKNQSVFAWEKVKIDVKALKQISALGLMSVTSCAGQTR
jgi:hypothetical protein